METAPARIPAASHREAMDWSLVLVSQSIETAIDYREEDASWGLLVAPAELDRAREALWLYRRENRRWPWRKPVFQGNLLFDWASLAWVCLLAVFYAANATDGRFKPAGVMDSQLVAQGAWWRLFTATWLHADLGHLAANATLGVVFLGLAMGLYGTGLGLLATCLAGALGNIFAWLVSGTPHHSLGASGMVMGSLGLLAVRSLTFLRKPHGRRYVATGILGGAMLFVLVGLSVQTDVLAHLGGFLGGIALGALLTPGTPAAENVRVNSLCLAGFALAVVLPWWLALAKAGLPPR